MIQLEDVRHRAEALVEVADLRGNARLARGFGFSSKRGPVSLLSHLLESVSEFDNRRLSEHAVGVHDQLAVLEGVQVAGDQQQIGAGLDLLQNTHTWVSPGRGDCDEREMSYRQEA